MEEKTMRKMFQLSFKEEVANALSHGLMALLCLCALPYVAVYSYTNGGVQRAFGVSVFVICLFLMFIVSCIYHSMEYNTQHKYIFRKLDHICILFAIAGSYTPIALSLIKGWEAVLILSIEWIMVIAGILLKAIAKRSFPKLSMGIYMVMGWTAILIIPKLLEVASPLFLGLIVGGGIMYTIGAFFYSKPHHKYFHTYWHICINIASVLHFIAIVYVM